MSPPPTAALALLGIWVLTIFFVTNETGYAQLLSDGDDAVAVPAHERESDLESEPERMTAGTDTDARAGYDGRNRNDGTTLDAVSDSGPNRESDAPSRIRSPADD